MAVDNYSAEASVVTLSAPRKGMPRLVPARDAFYTEVDAVRNAAEAAARSIPRDAASVATLQAIETFYYRLYIRQPGQPHPTAADFVEFVGMVRSTPEGARAWAAFSQCLALAVPLQHCVNVVMMTQDAVVDSQASRLAASLPLALAGMADREFAAEFREKAAAGMVVCDPPAAEFMAEAETGLVRAALEFAVAQMRRQRETQAAAQPAPDADSAANG